MSAKILSKIKDYGIFVFLIIYFIISYYLVSHFSGYSYTITPAESSPPPAAPAQSSADGVDSTVQTENLDFLPQGESESRISDDKSAYIPNITDTRTIKEYRGIIGIYDCFGELLGTHETDLSLLPFTDRSALCEGIMFDSEGEMRDFLESLDS